MITTNHDFRHMTFHPMLLVLLIGAEGLIGAPSTTTPADNPIPHSNSWFQDCEKRVAAAKSKPLDIMFIGDSLTQNFIESPTERWKLVGIDVWNKHYGNRNVLNFGVGSDGTQHLLWRLEHMDVAGLKPKVIVLEIGVNNMFSSASEIAAGTRAVLDKLHTMYPASKIILMAILPNGRNLQRTKEVNEITKSFADNKNIFSLDLSPYMPLDHGHFTGVGNDAVHLTPEGYEIWANHLDPLIDRLIVMPGPSRQ
jgi:lysophospholipase L1-like esterase